MSFVSVQRFAQTNNLQPDNQCDKQCDYQWDEKDLLGFFLKHLPSGQHYKKITIKPNWVLHATNPRFPIHVLVTKTRLIDLMIAACLEKYPLLETIIVCDVPVQSSNWHVFVEQTGIDQLMEKYRAHTKPTITFRDLRKERFIFLADGALEKDADADHGDPQGYVDVSLDAESFLEAISEKGARFSVGGYDPKETTSNHRQGFHRYHIARSILNCDLLINMPKMKSHQKSGITGALKNLVGMNGNKANLVHYRQGTSEKKGDEFPPNTPRLIVAKEAINKKLILLLKTRDSPMLKTLYRIGKRTWNLTKTLMGYTTTDIASQTKRYLIQGGAWHGNDTIWRMIYDLNKIIRYCDIHGKMTDRPQRDYVAFTDGLIAGEGDGPLQPLPVRCGVLMASDDPFLSDLCMARLMGFDYRKIKCLAHHRQFQDAVWGNFDPAKIAILYDSHLITGLDALPVIKDFMPPPGWKNHIERAARDTATHADI